MNEIIKRPFELCCREVNYQLTYLLQSYMPRKINSFFFLHFKIYIYMLNELLQGLTKSYIEVVNEIM